MIPVAPLRAQTGSLGGRQIKMGFDPESLVHLMGLLTNLYTDKELACIREYSTNARDAQIEAGHDGPIVVNTPNRLSPTLTIRDYGRGLSLDDIENVYALYGASTKRESDDYNGMMGIGGKSALTYTGQFTIVSRHAGRKIGVSVTTALDGTPTMEIVFDIESDEASGVEIIIPAVSGNSFEFKAQRFFAMWPAGSVNLNGKINEGPVGDRITDRIMLVEKGRYDRLDDLIVMGGVSYPVPGGLGTSSDSYGREFRVVAFVNNGEVVFAPNREALQDSAQNDRLIAAIRSEFQTEFGETVARKINSMDEEAAWNYYSKYSNYVKDVKWRGLPMTATTIVGEYRAWGDINDTSESAKKTSYFSVRNQLRNPRTLFVVDYPLASATRAAKLKAKKYIDSKALADVGTVYFVKSFDKTYAGWIKHSITWDELKKVEISPVPVAKRRAAFIVEDVHGNEVNANAITGKVVYYTGDDVKGNYRRNLEPRNFAQYVKTFDDTITVIRLKPTKVDAFRELHPTAQHYKSFVTAEWAKHKASLTPIEVASLTRRGYYAKDYSKLDETRIDDPRIVTLILEDKEVNKQKGDVDFYTRHGKVVNMVRSANTGLDTGVGTIDRPLDTEVRKCYPLLDTDKNIEHGTIYVNAVFAATKETK